MTLYNTFTKQVCLPQHPPIFEDSKTIGTRTSRLDVAALLTGSFYTVRDNEKRRLARTRRLSETRYPLPDLEPSDVNEGGAIQAVTRNVYCTYYT